MKGEEWTKNLNVAQSRLFRLDTNETNIFRVSVLKLNSLRGDSPLP